MNESVEDIAAERTFLTVVKELGHQAGTSVRIVELLIDYDGDQPRMQAGVTFADDRRVDYVAETSAGNPPPFIRINIDIQFQEDELGPSPTPLRIEGMSDAAPDATSEIDVLATIKKTIHSRDGQPVRTSMRFSYYANGEIREARHDVAWRNKQAKARHAYYVNSVMTDGSFGEPPGIGPAHDQPKAAKLSREQAMDWLAHSIRAYSFPD